MKKFLKYFTIASVLALAGCGRAAATDELELCLIPPATVTDKIDLDIRAGILNKGGKALQCDVEIHIVSADGTETALYNGTVDVEPGGNACVKHVVPTAGYAGRNEVVLTVLRNGRRDVLRKPIEVLPSDTRSTRRIDGAWAGISHWSDIEGKHWNDDIRQLTDDQWREMVRSMHSIGMDMIVIQEVFRNEQYVGKHETTVDNYEGLAYYPSSLYPGRMPVAADDPLEAIFSEADKLGMHVLPGVGLFAWFDFTPESLEWHKRVASELWEMYGHHDSFYAFYVSEESGGSLDNWEWTEDRRQMRKGEIVEFFRQFKAHCSTLAPAKPIMLATNSFGVPAGADTYPALLEHLDILCPFGFARMPEGDLTGKEAADMLQALCDEAGSHLWFDLEVFLFNNDQSLYPRDIEGIIADLTMLDNFEKVLCYQYPGVFSDPASAFRVGEEKTLGLFEDYRNYLQTLTYPR